MKNAVIFYSYLIFLLLIGCIFASCGGGSNNGTLPVTNTNSNIDSNPSAVDSTPTPVLSNVSVSGYIYAGNTVTEDGETVPRINVIDVPAYQADSSGNQPFTEQVLNTLKDEYPEDWAKVEIQELYAQLNKTLSESKPLPECNGQVYSVYSENPIPVGSDGHFDNTVLTGATDSNVKLEVALGEDNYAEVETLPSSGSINSSDATSAAVLKSCPEKIFAFPGEIVIFKVYSEPGINLKSAGLKFALNNASIGCITQPVYLCLFGAHKYQVAYGCVYIKHGLDTPVDTIITAKTNSGLKVEIPIEIVKSTLSISGHVYVGDGATLVKGYVKAYGPKGFCKLDASSGNYTLPRVFKSHGVTIQAIWWTIEDGKTVRHREQRIMDFLNGNVTDLNFGVLPLTDQYYKYISLEILDQKTAWEEQLGKEQGTQKTADWLNGLVPGNSPPSDIIEAIRDAEVDEYEPYRLIFHFKNGLETSLNSRDPYLPEDTSRSNGKISSSLGNKDSISGCIVASDATTVKNEDILLLGPASFEDYKNNDLMFDNLREEFENRYGASHVTSLHTRGKLTYSSISPYNKLRTNSVLCVIKNGEQDNVPRPENFLNIDKYGVIYIFAHTSGANGALMACPCYYDDAKLGAWLSQANINYFGIEWKEFYPYGPEDVDTKWFCEKLYLRKDFFANVYKNYDFSGSIVYLNGCVGVQFREATKFASNAKVFLGYNSGVFVERAQHVSYTFFNHMLLPGNAIDAYRAANDFNGDIFHIDTGPSHQNDNTYLPGDATVTVHKDNLKGKIWQNGNK